MLKVVEREVVRSYYLGMRFWLMFTRAKAFPKSEPTAISVGAAEKKFMFLSNDVSDYQSPH